jgi:hypothetical protein
LALLQILTLLPEILLFDTMYNLTPKARFASSVGNGLFNSASLDLHFAKTKSLVDATTGANLVDFTRASSGTYVDSEGVIQIASTDEPRFDHDPTTGESLGLLVEEQRTQPLVLQSERIDQSPWTLTLASVVAETSVLPNGGNNAYKLVPDSGSGAGLCRQNPTLADNTVYTISIFAKAAGFSQFFIQLFDKAGTFAQSRTIDLSTGGVSGSETGSSITSAVNYGNGWYRLILANVNSLSGATTPNVRFRVAGTGDGTSGIYFWGAQLEAGSFPTSYIPTTDATATRAADVASISGSNFSGWYRQDEGTVFAEATPIGDNGSNQFFYSISDGALGDEIRMFKTSGNSSITSALEDSVDGITSNFFGNTNSPFGQSFKTAHAFANNYASRAVGGLDSGVDNSVTVPAVNQIRIGARMNDTFPSNLHLFRLTYWPARLPDSTLQTITQ